MRIYVMRHGEAEMLARSDKERHLTDLGKKQSFAQAQWLKTSLKSTALHKVIVSPYVRAIETFEQVNIAFDHQLTNLTETWDAITPYGNSELVYDYLNSWAEENDSDDLAVLIISHLPLVGEIVAEFCGKNNVSFHPSTIAVVNWENDKATLIEAKLPSAVNIL
ncbi:phosphohistidine phosphatase SixA [Pasteurella langaaensis DSM 22999]|uniref:Phosphohistidine phosphatase SixA n=1 Tax=Alitibacter langaaensis DSM 22999 TaxID=1122935 RepID=A0A2U0SK97_9PAST|nr:phosphohistidine phosphatase SixA [Pasteurella langaaensis]PVX31775.1 phosphohistidine phosphatase SixA [Pasteurella langaaensis DSM 22999]